MTRRSQRSAVAATIVGHRAGQDHASTSSRSSESVLVALQEAGVIDASRQIPDLSEYQPPAETVARLETVLGRELPDDIGTIDLVTSDRLATVQQAVRMFDLITFGVRLHHARAHRARRSSCPDGGCAWSSGSLSAPIAALALGRATTRLVIEDITGALAQQGGTAVRAAIEAAVDQVMWVSFVVIAVAVLIAGLAMWLDRRQPRPEGALPPPPRTVADRVRERNREFAIAGLAAIAFFVLWRLGGPDLALLAAAATGIWLIGVSVLTGRVDRVDPATGLPGDPWIR